MHLPGTPEAMERVDLAIEAVDLLLERADPPPSPPPGITDWDLVEEEGRRGRRRGSLTWWSWRTCCGPCVCPRSSSGAARSWPGPPARLHTK